MSYFTQYLILEFQFLQQKYIVNINIKCDQDLYKTVLFFTCNYAILIKLLTKVLKKNCAL